MFCGIFFTQNTVRGELLKNWSSGQSKEIRSEEVKSFSAEHEVQFTQAPAETGVSKTTQ